MSLPVQGLTPPHHNSNTAGTTVANDYSRRSDGGEWIPSLSPPSRRNLKEETYESPKSVAMFAAYVWFIGRNEGTPTAEKEAVSFARDNWQAFLPCAHKGLGRLLIRIAGVRPRRGRQGRTTAGAFAG
jgi:hypothetical protein